MSTLEALLRQAAAAYGLAIGTGTVGSSVPSVGKAALIVVGGLVFIVEHLNGDKGSIGSILSSIVGAVTPKAPPAQKPGTIPVATPPPVS